MEFQVIKNDVLSTLRTFAEEVGGSIKKSRHEALVELPSKIGEGQVRGISVQPGLDIYLFNFKLRKRTQVHYVATDYQPLRFLFCLEGTFEHQVDEKHKYKYNVKPLSGSICASSTSKGHFYRIRPNSRVKFSVIEVDRKQFLEQHEYSIDGLSEKLAHIFNDLDFKHPFLQEHSNYSGVSEVIARIFQSGTQGIAEKLLMESRVLNVFSLHIEQQNNNDGKPGKKVRLRKYDLEQIFKARDILIEDLENGPTIKELSKKVGINEHKLKNGFKQVFDETIYKYLRNRRLEYARSLFDSDHLSVSEVADRVGYTNKSHFSRRFKERYGVLPKDYLKNTTEYIIQDQEDKG